MREKCVNRACLRILCGNLTGTRILTDSIRAEVGVRLVECNRVPHRVDCVIEVVDGFIQLLAVLVFLPFVIAKLPDEVHTPSRDKKRSRMEELDSVLDAILSLSCSVSIESVSMYLVDALWLSGVTDNNIRSIDFDYLGALLHISELVSLVA